MQLTDMNKTLENNINELSAYVLHGLIMSIFEKDKNSLNTAYEFARRIAQQIVWYS